MHPWICKVPINTWLVISFWPLIEKIDKLSLFSSERIKMLVKLISKSINLLLSTCLKRSFKQMSQIIPSCLVKMFLWNPMRWRTIDKKLLNSCLSDLMYQMFISWKIQSYHASLQVNLKIISGRSTALVCDSGDTYTRVVAVHDGYCLYKSARSIAYAGSTLTNSIRRVV